VNSRPERLDPPRRLLRQAINAGCRLAIDTDAHAPGQLEWQINGCERAAECGADPMMVVNTLSADALRSWAAGTRLANRATHLKCPVLVPTMSAAASPKDCANVSLSLGCCSTSTQRGRPPHGAAHEPRNPVRAGSVYRLATSSVCESKISLTCGTGSLKVDLRREDFLAAVLETRRRRRRSTRRTAGCSPPGRHPRYRRRSRHPSGCGSG